MPSPKIPCPTCDGLMSATAQQCRRCKPTYGRTAKHRQHMSEVLTGKPKPWLQGRKRPHHSEYMKAWWTPERREERRQKMLAWNPLAEYHGFSAEGARRLREAIGHCELCGHDGSESRLDTHHRNRDKRDQSLKNLMVLCHRCHMQEHAKTQETGWDAYWRKRRMSPD